MGSTKKYLLVFGVHATLWLFLLVLPVLTITPFIVSGYGELAQNFYPMFVYSSIVLLLIFYTNYFILFPKFYLNKKRFFYFILVILFILVIIFLTRISLVRFHIFHQGYSKPKSIFIAFAIFRIILAFFLSGALVIYERWQKSEKERLISEVNFLKAQINPHFLFNTLNGIYTLVLKKSDKAANSVSQLSSIMQYVATESNNVKVPLEKEIEYITNYIELQKLRLTNSTQVNYSVIGQTSSLLIEPLLLINFIENAFKYGISTEKESLIKIALNISNNELILFIQNQKHANQLKTNNSGIGLENTISRLNNTYAGKYSLDIIDDDSNYTVNLSLQLK